MGDADFSIANCPTCGKNTFVVWKNKKVGRDEFIGKCFACDAKKEMKV